MTRQVEVMLFRVGKLPQLTMIDATLKAQQDLVGGLIQPLPLSGDGLDLVCNEGALLMDLPFNCDMRIHAFEGEYYSQPIMGDFYCARWDQHGEITSLSDDDVSTIAKSFGEL